MAEPLLNKAQMQSPGPVIIDSKQKEKEKEKIPAGILFNRTGQANYPES